MSSSRRNFIKTASVLAAGSVIPFNTISKSRAAIFPNDKIRVGLIGANGQGFIDLLSFLKNPEIECVAMCDIDRNVLTNRTDALIKRGFSKPRLYVDYRKMLENKDIDVIINGTPDHWHCLILTDALEAGKHAYIEKPVGNSIAEINIMQRAVKKHGKIVQVGQWPCLILTDALEAGKHAYIEKPVGNSIAEINIMQRAVKKHGKIVQVGQW